MRKTTVKTKPPSKRSKAWFERKVTELKARLEKLPVDRREALMRALEQERP